MYLKSVRNLLFVSLGILALSCATKKEESSGEATEKTSDSKEWKEMDEFHMIMAETFHPFKDSSNLEPAKTRAGELVAAAEKWGSSTLPEKVNNEDMKTKLAALKEGTESLVQIVNKGDDKAIGDQLTKVHDLFHAIQETWYGGGDGHEAHH